MKTQNRLSRDFKGIWIPREIWLRTDLSIQEKALWAEVDSLYDEERDGCYAENPYLMEFMGVKERQLQNMLASLKEKGLLVQVSFDGRRRVIKALCGSEVQKIAPLECKELHPRGAKNCTPLIYREKKEDKTIEPPPPTSSKIPPPSSAGGGGSLVFKNCQGNERILTESDVYRYMLKFPQFTTDIVMQAITEARRPPNPVNDPFSYLVGICNRLMNKKQPVALAPREKKHKGPGLYTGPSVNVGELMKKMDLEQKEKNANT